MKLTIITIIYLLLPYAVFAHEGEENITVISEADFIGPLIAILIIIVAIVVSKRIKKSRKKLIDN